MPSESYDNIQMGNWWWPESEKNRELCGGHQEMGIFPNNLSQRITTAICVHCRNCSWIYQQIITLAAMLFNRSQSSFFSNFTDPEEYSFFFVVFFCCIRLPSLPDCSSFYLWLFVILPIPFAHFLRSGILIDVVFLKHLIIFPPSSSYNKTLSPNDCDTTKF